MASPNTTHALPPKPRLQRALLQIGSEIEDQPLRSSSLARIMRETFGGSDAGGAWDWRMAYDMMQAAAVMQLVQDRLEDFAWSFAYHQHPGFENNEGGYGTLTWDISADSITLDHAGRYVECSHSCDEGL